MVVVVVAVAVAVVVGAVVVVAVAVAVGVVVVVVAVVEMSAAIVGIPSQRGAGARAVHDSATTRTPYNATEEQLVQLSRICVKELNLISAHARGKTHAGRIPGATVAADGEAKARALASLQHEPSASAKTATSRTPRRAGDLGSAAPKGRKRDAGHAGKKGSKK